MRIPRLILSDFLGLVRVCGWRVAARWLLGVATHLGECRREGNLASVDRLFGDGPVRVRRGSAAAWVAGPTVLTGVREIWVRNAYLTGPIRVAPGDVILDLGCGTGLFTTQALTAAAGVRAVAVEAEADRCATFARMAERNGFADRVRVVNAFVRDEPTLLAAADLDRIDLLKCDIEGSEFGLFGDGSRLLAISRQVAIELHPHAGDADALAARIAAAGFRIETHRQGPTVLLFGVRAK